MSADTSADGKWGGSFRALCSLLFAAHKSLTVVRTDYRPTNLSWSCSVCLFSVLTQEALLTFRAYSSMILTSFVLLHSRATS